LKVLCFITKPYSVSILEPIQAYCQKEKIDFVWFKASTALSLQIKGKALSTTEEVLQYNPDAVIVSGNVVPDYWPGLKVQIFHGLGEEKKGHYDITDFFDLYCTPGPFMTEKFQELQKIHGTFLVDETGWSKMDLIQSEMNVENAKKQLGLDPNKKMILYAPTFSPKYTSASDLFSVIKSHQFQELQWCIKFHDLETKDIIDQYLSLESDTFTIIRDLSIIPWMAASDCMIADTSSVTYEYLLFNRPIITYRAKTRKDKGINIKDSGELINAINQSLNDPDEYSNIRKEYIDIIHPYTDGKSSERVINAIKTILNENKVSKLKPKTPNWFRKRRIRKMVKP
jgi:CDP-glycerol glycerophosphotransferase (TagB/SpsB family)